MTVVTTRPNATHSSSGFTPSAGTRHACTSDDSDSTLLTAAALDNVVLDFAEPSIPAGALVTSVALRARVGGTSAQMRFYLYPAGLGVEPFYRGDLIVTWQNATTSTVIPAAAYTTTPSEILAELVHQGGNALYVYELYADTTYVAKPVTAPSGPTGTIGSNLPTVTWANTLDTDGGAQTHYQVRVFTSAQYGAGGFNAGSSTATWDSGDTTSAAASARIASVLADGAYRAYVRVGQTVNGTTHWSDYAYTAFTVSATLPAVPDTPIVTVDNTNARISVYVEGNTGSATTTHLEIERSDDAGVTWEPVRLLTDTDGLLAGTSGTVYDYEAPNGTLMTYRVRAQHLATDLVVASAWATTATGTWSSDSWWLKCPESPSLNAIVVPAGLPSYQRPARQGVFQALGREDTVIIADKRGAPRGGLTLQIDSQAEQDDIDALLDSNLTLLLQGPPAHHAPDRYLRFGDQDRARWIDKAWIGEVIDTLQWWQVAKPAGVVDSWPA